MLIIQYNKNDSWIDGVEKENIELAKAFIESQIKKTGKAAEKFRIVEVVAKCRTMVMWDEYKEDEVEEDPEPELEGREYEPEGNLDIKNKKTNDKQLLLDFLRLTCQLRRFPKTQEMDDALDVSNYNVYYTSLGSKSNICDMIFSILKKDTIDKDFMKVIKEYWCYSECDNAEKRERCEMAPTQCLYNQLVCKDED